MLKEGGFQGKKKGKKKEKDQGGLLGGHQKTGHHREKFLVYQTYSSGGKKKTFL